MKLYFSIDAYEFMSDINGMDSFINEEVPSQEQEYVWDEPYRRWSDSPDMEDVVDQEKHEKAVVLVPAQDVLFALILWYVAKTLFRL